MFSLIFGLILIAIAVSLRFFNFLPNELPVGFIRIKKIVIALFITVGTVLSVVSGFNYNDAGQCAHSQTAFGTERYTCNAGWYFSGWGRTTEYPHYFTIVHSSSKNAVGSSVNPAYRVRMSDNWTGDVTQTTRFGIPQDEVQFMKMHRDFRSPTRLITTVLQPAVTSSLDSVSNLFSMEEYYAGGKRDQYKTEYRDAVVKGRAKVNQVINEGSHSIVAVVAQAEVSDSPSVEDTAKTGNVAPRKITMEKVVDGSGSEIREAHDYSKYGITVSSAIIEDLDPDDKFENQIQARKDAASRRIVAQEQRREQEEQRLLAIQTGETDIAKKQATARVQQIERTTNAETEKKLTLIEAEKLKEQAVIAKDTAKLNLDKAKTDAEAQKVLADAEAYAKKAVMVADGALDKKLAAYVETQKFWADAAAKMNVSTQVFGGSNATNGASSAEHLLQMLSVKTAKDLAIDMKVDSK